MWWARLGRGGPDGWIRAGWAECPLRRHPLLLLAWGSSQFTASPDPRRRSGGIPAPPLAYDSPAVGGSPLPGSLTQMIRESFCIASLIAFAHPIHGGFQELALRRAAELF